MIRHLFIAALRNMAANWLQSAIAIVGLAIGIAAALLMALVVRSQLSFDHFIPGYERTYMGVSAVTLPARPTNYNDATHRSMAGLIKLNVPEVESTTRLMLADKENFDGGVTLKQGNTVARETVYWAEPNLADVLPLPVYRGDLKAALARPDGIVLARSTARKYFGSDEVLGRFIYADGHPMIVRAIIENIPDGGSELQTSTFISSLAPFSAFARDKPDAPGSVSITVRTYLRLKAGSTIASVERRIPAFVESLRAGVRGPRFPYVMPLLRIDRVNLMEGLHPGTQERITEAGLIGLLILFVASVNFVNLLTARAARRAIEVGIRKSCGAQRRDLIGQFLGESILTVMVAACIAVALSEWLLPSVNAFLHTGATFNYLHDPALAATLLSCCVLMGILSGSYPAFILSAFHPARVLKGLSVHFSNVSAVRSLLVVAQFAVLIALLVAASVIYQQHAFALREGLRAEIDQVLMVRDGCRSSFRTAIRKLPGVEGMSCTDASLLDGDDLADFKNKGETVLLDVVRVDLGIFSLYDIHPVAGSLMNLSPEGDYEENDARGVILNQAAAKRLGFTSPEEAVGRNIARADADSKTTANIAIAAVVPDFAFYSVERPIEPTAYIPGPSQPGSDADLASIKLRGQEIPETLIAIDGLWAATGGKGTISRFFVDEHMQEQYLSMIRVGQLFAIFSGVAVLLACLGLLGIAVSTAEGRTKEIGVRKAMGASSIKILALLLFQFAQPVLWANVIAWPVTWWLMHRWLSGFAYHVELHAWLFVAASVAALAIALLTVAGQAFLTARQKPVLALRYE